MSEKVSTIDDEQRRATYLSEVVCQLYPSGWQARSDRHGSSHSYVVVPHRRKPRVLIPAASRKIASRALMRYSRPATRLARWKRDAAVAALRLGLDRLLLPHRLHLGSGDGESSSINEYLGDVLGQNVHVTVHIGPARANRKPVLQVLDDQARTIAFTKVGVNDLTRSLVAAEAEALRNLKGARDLAGLRAPQLIHHGNWGEFTVLVTEALPAWRAPQPCSDHRRLQAMRTLAESSGTVELPLGHSPYLEGLRHRLDTLAQRGENDCSTLTDAAADLIAELRDHTLTFGAWHGDWTEWNTSADTDVIHVWDWERFETNVPLGFDLLHYRLQTDIVSLGLDPTTAVLQLISQAGDHLVPFGISPSKARSTALLYLVDLAARYLTDRQEQAGAALGALGQWLLPTLLRHVAKRSV